MCGQSCSVSVALCAGLVHVILDEAGEVFVSLGT